MKARLLGQVAKRANQSTSIFSKETLEKRSIVPGFPPSCGDGLPISHRLDLDHRIKERRPKYISKLECQKIYHREGRSNQIEGGSKCIPHVSQSQSSFFMYSTSSSVGVKEVVKTIIKWFLITRAKSRLNSCHKTMESKPPGIPSTLSSPSPSSSSPSFKEYGSSNACWHLWVLWQRSWIACGRSS